MNINETAQKLIDLGLKVWGQNAGKDRIYIDKEKFGEVFGLEINAYKTGNIQSAYLNGEKISNSKAYKLITNCYYDINAEKFVGNKLDPII